MKTNGSINIAGAAIAGLLVVSPETALGQKYEPVSKNSPPIIHGHPETVVVLAGTDVTFTVQADNPPVSTASPAFAYQWQRLSPGTEDFENVFSGASNNTYSIFNVTSNDVALYRVKVSSSSGASVSEPASLLVYTTNSPVTVYGSPVVSGGSSGNCPGGYVGYVNYKKSVAQGWGWAPSHSGGNTNHTAEDLNSSTTKVEAVGNINDRFCATRKVAPPGKSIHLGSGNPPTGEDNKYRFTIYFPSAPVPQSPYPITLEGFLP